MVFIYYELCEKIWGGSPATDQIDGGLETTDIADSITSHQSDTSAEHACEGEQDDPVEVSPSGSEGSVCGDGDHPERTQATTSQRREFLDSALKDYKQVKMKRKLPVDAQLIGTAQEELAMKKKLFDQMDRMEKQHQDTISQLSSSMANISNSISDGFSILKTLLLPQPPLPHQQVCTQYSPCSVMPPAIPHCDPNVSFNAQSPLPMNPNPPYSFDRPSQ